MTTQKQARSIAHHEKAIRALEHLAQLSWGRSLGLREHDRKTYIARHRAAIAELSKP